MKARIRKGTDTIIDAIETTQSHPDAPATSHEAAPWTRHRKRHKAEMTRALLSQTREQGTGYVPIGGAVVAARQKASRRCRSIAFCLGRTQRSEVRLDAVRDSNIAFDADGF